MRLLGDKNSVSYVMWHAASFSNNEHKISSKTQNERWMGTGRRSVCDNYIFRKHSQTYPGKPLKFDRNPLENPGKEFHFTAGHPERVAGWYLIFCEWGGIVVRAHASRAEGLRFEPDSMPWLNARSLFTQQRMGTWWQHWGDKGGDERKCPPYLTCRWLSIVFSLAATLLRTKAYGTTLTFFPIFYS